MDGDKFGIIIGAIVIGLGGLLYAARRVLERVAPTTATTKDDEALARIKKIESIVEGIAGGFSAKGDDKSAN